MGSINVIIKPIAAARLRLLMDAEPDANELGIQLQMTSSGCGSLAFSITLTTKSKEDRCEELEGIRLFYREGDHAWLNGLVVDLNRETGRFQIFHSNPPSTSCPIAP
ncbi:hypothetical protein ACQCN2_17145 [Brevibacillus ginsengisoli]|uniref:hypothetical protein n=1 Tax=Brevibacillus ginsengisoli TaxID=363854 RepID=UPI003CF9BEEC